MRWIFLQLILMFLLVFSALPESWASSPCPYANKNLGKAKCEKFGKTNVLRFDTKQKPKAHIVCIHGLGLCAKAYFQFAEEMSKDGYRTCSIDVRGFGASRDINKQKLALKESVEEIKELLTYIRETEPDTKTILLGESMGGSIAIAIAAESPNLIDGIICSAPAWKVYKRKRNTAKGFVDLVISRPGPAANSVMKQATTDKKLRKHWREDHDHTLDLSPGEVFSFMRFIGKTPRRAEQITTPILLIHGLRDRLIKPEGTARLFRKIKSEKKCLLLLDDGEHLIVEEGQFDDTIISAIKKWILNCHCPTSSEKHTNAVVFIKSKKLNTKRQKRVARIFRLAGINKFKVNVEFGDQSVDQKLTVIDNNPNAQDEIK